MFLYQQGTYRWVCGWNKNDALLPADSLARVHVQREAKGEIPPRRQATDRAPTSLGLRVSCPRTRCNGWPEASDPLLQWLTWELQDNAVLQANPVSYQLTRYHMDKDVTFGLGCTRLYSRLGWDKPDSHLETCPIDSLYMAPWSVFFFFF